jgi:outer membrane protein assembly factor BamB
VIAGNCLYLATRTGVVHAVDRTTGLELWRVDVEAPVPSWDDDLRDYHEDGMAILPVGDTLYVRTESGVVALRNA